MAWDSYTLPTITTVSGDLKITLYVDSSLPALTVPSILRLKNIGELTEEADIEAGILEIDTVNLIFEEDYSTYSEGFWYKILEGYPTVPCQIMLILSENGSDTYFFRGSVYRDDLRWEPYYVSTNSATWKRTVIIPLVSTIYALKNISTEDLRDEIINNLAAYEAVGDVITGVLVDASASPPYYDGKMIRLNTLIRIMLELAMVDSGACVSRNCDFGVYFEGDYESGWLDPFESGSSTHGAYVMLQRETSPGSDTFTTCGFFAGVGGLGDNMSWVLRFENCWEVLNIICGTFCLIPRYYYGDSDGYYAETNYHTIELLSRGQSFAKVTMPTKLIEAPMKSGSVNYNVSVYVTHPRDITDNEYYYQGEYGIGEPPQNSKFDYELNVDFCLWQWRYGELWAYDLEANSFFRVEKLRYYNYQTSANVEVVTDNPPTPSNAPTFNLYARALLYYFQNRFTSGRKTYSIKYKTLLASSTHENAKIMMRTDINDGVATETYYANKVSKNIEENTLTVDWINE